jgi:hypothetical protein
MAVIRALEQMGSRFAVGRHLARLNCTGPCTQRGCLCVESLFYLSKGFTDSVESTYSPARKLLPLLVLFILALATFPLSWAAGDLVVNGDFESGKLDGWTANNSQVLKSSNYVPAHSGKYSARIGTSTTPGGISQIVSIPAKSSSKFTAWYRIEKGSTLTIFLKRSDGTVIQQWPATSVALWASISYDLDVSYAGQSITIEIDGIGYRETTSQTQNICYEECDPTTNVCYSVCEPITTESHKDYYSYIDDVSFTSVIAIYETNVSITGLPEQLSTKLSVDGEEFAPISGAEFKAFSFKIGESHKMSVEPYVYKDNATRYYCASDSTMVSSDGSISFSYTPQYFLAVSSPYGSTTGAGWYDEGSEASFALDRTTFPIPDITGTLGAKRVFVNWNGDASGSPADGKVTMDGPKSISAVWAVNNTLFYESIAIIVGACIAGIALAYRLVGRRRQALKPPFKRPTEFPAKEFPEGSGVVVSGPTPEEQDILDRLERLERSREDDTITEKAYRTLKEDLEKKLAEIRARRP